MRLAVLAPGQGLPELERIAGVLAETAGWDAERRDREAAAYRAMVALRYQAVERGERR